MSKYTVSIQNIVKQKSGFDWTDPLNQPGYTEAIAAARQHIFNFDYPIFAESYREVLETKILKHFYFREIAFETYGQWHLKLDDKMNLIMPYYNQLYESQGLDFDPFNDTDYHIEHAGDGSKTGDYKKEENVIHDGDTTDNITRDSTNTKKTDNIDTISNNETMKNTHEDATDFSNHETVTKGSKVTVKNTGTVQNTGQNTSKDTGTDSTEYNGNDKTVTNNDNWNMFSDTPQGELDNFKNPGYYTNVTNDKQDGTSTLTAKDTSETTYGKTTTDTANNTQTNNLSEETQNSGVDTLEYTRGQENTGEYTNTTTGTKTDTLDGTVKDTGNVTENRQGTNDFTDKTTGTSGEKITTTDAFLRHVYGKRGTKTYASILLELRETFLNIDQMIINELEDLFFLLW